MKTFILFTTLFITCTAVAFAQKKDYVITLKGDTIQCSISKPLIGAPRYKVNGGENIAIHPDSISEYYRANKKLRCRAVYNGDTTKPEFMTVVENGTVSLYEVVNTYYNGTVTTSTKNWYVGKGSNRVSELKTSALLFLDKSRKDRKDEFANMLQDKHEIYDTYIKQKKFSFKQIQKLVHWYNTGEKMD